MKFIKNKNTNFFSYILVDKKDGQELKIAFKVFS